MNFITGRGWQEAVTSVRDLDRWIADLEVLAGWTLAHRGRTDDGLLKAWRLPRSVQAEDAVMVCLEDPARWLRLISFKGVQQQQIRSSGRPWETGGLFSILIYAADTQAAFRCAQNVGWTAHNDPVVMEFGGRELLNVVLRAPDGCNFGLYQPLKPAPEAPFPFAKLGAPFNGQQMVRNAQTAEQFYCDKLTWESWFSGEIKLTCNNFGIPDNMVGLHPKHVGIMHGGERHYGQVELVQWTGFEGRDFAELAVPPNLGHLALRWPVHDLDIHIARFKSSGVPLHMDPVTVHLPPIGEVRLCSIRTPDGVLIELVQPANGLQSEEA